MQGLWRLFLCIRCDIYHICSNNINVCGKGCLLWKIKFYTTDLEEDLLATSNRLVEYDAILDPVFIWVKMQIWILYKDGTEDHVDVYYDGHKIKRKNIASIVYANENTYIVYGNFEINEYGIVTTSFDERIASQNIVEVAEYVS